MYIYLIVVWNHSFWDGLFNNKKPTYRNKGPTLPIRGSIYLYNPRHPATDKHSNTSHNTEVRSHDDVLLSYGWWRKTKWETHYLIKLSKYNIVHDQDVGQLDTVSRGNPINQVNEKLWEMLCWWKHWNNAPAPGSRVPVVDCVLQFATFCHFQDIEHWIRQAAGWLLGWADGRFHHLFYL